MSKLRWFLSARGRQVLLLCDLVRKFRENSNFPVPGMYSNINAGDHTMMGRIARLAGATKKKKSTISVEIESFVRKVSCQVLLYLLNTSLSKTTLDSQQKGYDLNTWKTRCVQCGKWPIKVLKFRS